MSTCTCTSACTACTCNAVPNEIANVYRELKDFINKNYVNIQSTIAENLKVREQILDGISNNVYYIENDVIQSIVTSYMLESTLNVWQTQQQYLIPRICRDIVLNIIREVYIRAEEPWKKIYSSSKLHIKVTCGDISFGIIYPDIKSFPEMEFSSYDDLFEGFDLTPNYRFYDRTPYGSITNWFINMDWIRLLGKSVNIAPSTGSSDYEVPITEVLKGWMIYRCIRMALEDTVLSTKSVKMGDRIILYNQVYQLSKILGKSTADVAYTIGFKKVLQ